MASVLPESGPSEDEGTPRGRETLTVGPTEGSLLGEVARLGRGPVVSPADRYVVESELARGGLGRILKAYDRVLERWVALKEVLRGRGFLEERLAREARVTSRLEHPGIVPVYDAGQWPDGRRYYAMKLVSGRTLLDAINAAPALAQRLALLPRVVAVAEAVAYAHSKRVLHRDLKPANVILGDFGETFVADWGLAKDLEGPSDPMPTPMPTPTPAADGMTPIGAVLGTRGYMAPEQERGDAVDERADVYALGALLYHTLTGVAPAKAQARPTPEAAVASTEVPRRHEAPTIPGSGPLPLEELVPEIPAELAAVVRKAMAPAAADRYADARELAADLARYLTGHLLEAHRYTVWSLARRWIGRHRAVVAVCAAATIICIAVALTSMSRIIRARRTAETRTDELTLAQSRMLLEHDPTLSLAYLKQYSLTAPRWDEAYAIASEAIGHGVARHEWLTDDPLCAAWSPDGAWIAICSSDGHAHLSRPDGTRYLLGADEGSVNEVAFSPDGARLAVVADKGVRIWDHLGGSAVSRLIGRLDESDEAVTIAFSPDGRQLATGDGTSVVVWDLATSARRVLAGHTEMVHSVAFASDGALASTARDNTLRVWDLATGRGRVLGVLQPGENQVRRAAIGSVVTVANDTIRRWDLARDTSEVVATLPGAELYGLDVAADGTIAVGTVDGQVRLFDPRRGNWTLLGHRAYIQGLALSGDGRHLVSAARDGRVRTWDLAPPDGERIAGNARKVLAARFGEQVEVVTVGAAGEIALSGSHGAVADWQPPHPAEASANSAAFSTRGDRVALLLEDGSVRAWNRASRSWRELGRFPAARRLTYLADAASHLLVREMHGMVLLDEQREHPACALEVRERVTAGAVSADGQLVALGLASASGTTEVKLLEVAGCAVRSLFVAPGAIWVHALAFSPDGRKLASSDEGGTVSLFDRDTGQVRRLAGHKQAVYMVAWSADGARLASAGDDEVRLWDPARGTGARVLRTSARPVTIGFAPHDVLLIVDVTAVRELDLGTGLTRVRPTHDGTIVGAWLAVDGAAIVSVSDAGTVREWPAVPSVTPPAEPAALRAWLDTATDVTAADGESH
jgi:WD40 repeat protein